MIGPTPPGAPPPSPAATPAAAPEDRQARATAEAFEAVLLGQLSGVMLETAQPDGDPAGGHGEAMFRGVLAEKIGAEMARRGGIGLAPSVMQQIISLQQGKTR